jgi:hypothetical protein
VSVLPQLERELLAAHRRVAQRGRFAGVPLIGGGRSVGRLSRSMAAVPVLLTVLVTVAVVAVALTAINHQHPSAAGGAQAPTSPPPPPPTYTPAVGRAYTYMFAAQRYTFAHDPACKPPHPVGRNGRATISEGAPSAAMLSAFAILRRPQTAQDTPAGGAAKAAAPVIQDVFVKYVRRAQYHYGGGYYLIPAGNVVGEQATPARCDTEQAAALRHELRRTPKRVRQLAIRVQANQLAWQRYRQQHPEGICLEHLNSHGFGGGGCGAVLAETEQHPGLGMSEGDAGGGWIQAGLVPDGVASITYHFAGKPATRTRRKPERAFTITVPVIDNLVVFKLPPGVDQSAQTLVLRAADGVVIRTIHPGQ